jgi:hypothetical protein
MPSIDAMLENRPELWPALKMIVACQLISAEMDAIGRTLDVDEDWLALVIQRMAVGAKTIEEFVTSPVSFVTFNYDRFLEYRLVTALSEHYGQAEQEVWKALASIPIIHVHGSLGPLPGQPVLNRETAFPFGFESPDTDFVSIAIRRAEHNIKIVHDASATDDAFAQTLRLFQAAQRVLFFGFSFGQENVEHLQVGRIPKETEVYCTTYGMTEAEVKDAIGPGFGNRSLLFKLDMKIKDFLRNHIELLK